MIKFAMLTETAKQPTRKHETDAGIDLYADFGYEGREWDMRVGIPEGNTCIINTGVSVSIPKGYFGWITNKSRNDFIIGGGIVDEGYQGELLVKVVNTTKDFLEIKHGQAIAQLLIIPCLVADVETVDGELLHTVKSARGGSGGIVSQAGLDIILKAREGDIPHS